MISLLGKKVDINPTKAVIIDLSNLDELSRLGEVYDIEVFKADSNRNFLSDFKNLVASLESKLKDHRVNRLETQEPSRETSSTEKRPEAEGDEPFYKLIGTARSVVSEGEG